MSDESIEKTVDENPVVENPAVTDELVNAPVAFPSLEDDTLFEDFHPAYPTEDAEIEEFVPDGDIHSDLKDLEAMLKPFWENLEQIKNAQIALAKDFSAKLKYDAVKQGQIDKLYQENQSYRDDVIEKFKLQIVLAVIEQIDDADKQIAHFDKQEETEKNYAKLLNGFRDVTVSFRDMLLERFDVSSFQSESGTPFDPKRQRALKTSDTAEALQNKTVAATLRPGYEKNDGTVVRPEMVEVWRYSAAFLQE